MMPMASSRRAVIIGVDDYADSSITNLLGAVNDAKEMHARLTEFGDFTVASEHLLLNENATAWNIRQAVSDLLWKTEKTEFSLVYFSGHGLTDSYGNGFLAPHDMAKDAPLVCGIRMQELRDIMIAAKNKTTILLILDCCYSGIAADGDKAVGGTPPLDTVEQCLVPLNEATLSAGGKLILTSAGSDERSREIATSRHRLGKEPPHPHGAFTFELLEGLDGRASHEEHEVTLGSLISCVTEALAGRAEHQPKLYGSSVTALDGIFFSRASRQEEIDRRVHQVEALLDEGNISSLFRAINDLESVFSDSPGLEDALSLRSRIDERLGPMRAPAWELLLNRTLELSDGCDATFLRLCDLMSRELNFQLMVREDASFRNLMLYLFLVATEQAQIKLLQSALTTYHSATLRNKLNPTQDASTVGS
jgi:uncharacterized caspase-like protein